MTTLNSSLYRRRKVTNVIGLWLSGFAMAIGLAGLLWILWTLFYNGIGALPQGAGLPLQVTGRAGIPAGARAVVVNVTATNPSWWGFFTVYSTSSPRPTASNLNFSPGQTVPNLVVCGVGGDGRIMIFNALGTTDAIVDVVGWYS